MSDAGVKKVCPDCAEEVQTAAKVCRFCSFRFDGAQLVIAPGFVRETVPAPEPEAGSSGADPLGDEEEESGVRPLVLWTLLGVIGNEAFYETTWLANAFQVYRVFFGFLFLWLGTFSSEFKGRERVAAIVGGLVLLLCFLGRAGSLDG